MDPAQLATRFIVSGKAGDNNLAKVLDILQQLQTDMGSITGQIAVPEKRTPRVPTRQPVGYLDVPMFTYQHYDDVDDDEDNELYTASLDTEEFLTRHLCSS